MMRYAPFCSVYFDSRFRDFRFRDFRFRDFRFRDFRFRDFRFRDFRSVSVVIDFRWLKKLNFTINFKES